MIGCVLVMDVLNKTPGSSTQINITVESRSIFEAPNDITMRNITSITGSCSGGNKLHCFFLFLDYFLILTFNLLISSLQPSILGRHIATTACSFLKAILMLGEAIII